MDMVLIIHICQALQVRHQTHTIVGLHHLCQVIRLFV